MAGNVVMLCAAEDCPRAASYGPWCVSHRQGRRDPQPPHAGEMSADDVAYWQARVAADALPLFLKAMQHLLGQQFAALVDEAAALPNSEPDPPATYTSVASVADGLAPAWEEPAWWETTS